MFCSSGKTEGLKRKDKLYNKLVEKFTAEKLNFPPSIVKSEGSYFIQVLKEYYFVLRDICTIKSRNTLFHGLHENKSFHRNIYPRTYHFLSIILFQKCLLDKKKYLPMHLSMYY